VVGDGQRIAVLAVAELEFAFEVGAPQLVGRNPSGELGPGGTMTPPADTFDQAVAVQNGVDRTLGRDARACQKFCV
jgi:hypothetical protein